MSKPSTFVIAVSGSRTITDTAHVNDILDEEYAYAAFELGLDVVMHLGDARGVDSIALEWARNRGVTRVVFYADRKGYDFWLQARGLREWGPEDEQAVLAADWDRDGKRAGMIRNHAMIAGVNDERGRAPKADLLCAIWDGESRGTANAIGTARQWQVFTHRWADSVHVMTELPPYTHAEKLELLEAAARR